MSHAANDDATSRIRVVLADGDRLTRLAVKETLRRHGAFVIAAEAADGDDAVRLACHYRPDLLVTEAVLPRLDGLEVVERVAQRAPEVRSVLMIRDDDDEELGLVALRRGASGVVCKADPPQRIAEDLLAVHAGGAAIPPRLTTAVLGELRRLPEPGSGLRPVRSPLTDREWEVLDLMLAGDSPAEVAEQLVLTRDTVASHVKNIMRKLDVHSRDELLEAGRRMLEPVAA
ncbi:MAG: response regulator transcription factor [Solirubrobacteraceae bacterium]|nr:response regulator transcription factor [Solirubrobacteraceae bacterium]